MVTGRYLDCGCYISPDGERTWCPTCSSQSMHTLVCGSEKRPMTDLHFAKDDSYSRLYAAIVAISNASYAMKNEMPPGLRGYQYELDEATREAWAILRDEVAVDPDTDKTIAEVRATMDSDRYPECDRVAILREILDEYDERRKEVTRG